MITIKKFKYFASGSQETNCFTADVCLAGKKVGVAENDGHGGETFVHFDTLAAQTVVEAFVAGLPERDLGDGDTYKQTISSVVDDLVYAELGKREAARLEKKWLKKQAEAAVRGAIFFVMRVGEDNFMEITSAPANVEKWKAKTLAEYPGATVFFGKA